LFNWSEDEFLKHTEGSAIRRIGYHSWQRNIAVALGNSQPSSIAERDQVLQALESKLAKSNDMVSEHIQWAINSLIAKPLTSSS